MRKHARSLGLLAGVLPLMVGSLAFAQDPNGAVPAPVSAVISGPSDIGVGRTIILDASASRTVGERIEYRWTIDETKQSIGRSVEAIFTPEAPGRITFRLNVRSTGLDGKVVEAEAIHEVIVFQRKVVAIADASIPREKLEEHALTAMNAGVYLRIIQPDPSTPVLSLEDATYTLLAESKDVLTGADSVLIWSEGIAGLQALMRAARADTAKAAQIQNQTIIQITERSLGTLERTTRGAFSVLKPKEIIITRTEAINPLLSAPGIQEFKEILQSRDIDSVALTPASVGTRVWNVMSLLVNYLLSHGVSGQTVILLLMLPVIATIFTFLKQVIGITTFGLYTPSVVALSFLALGWWVGLLFLLFILITGYFTREVMKRWRLLYIPKVAIILTVVSITLLLLVALGSAFGLNFSRDSVFILLILSTLAENFLNLKTEEGWWSAVLGIGETVLGSLLCVLIVQWQFLQSLVLAYPELILLTLVINAFLGRWTGLRLIEYFRFREVFKHLQEE